MKIEKPKTDGDFLGFDILGSGYGVFYTYLFCDGLAADIKKKYDLKINEYGLIANSYKEVADFVKLLEGTEEGGEWLPFAVYKHS